MKTVFTERLARVMFTKDIKQAELVDKTGIDKGSMSSYVNGRYMPNAKNMAKIAKALGVSVEYLLGKEDISLAKMSMPTMKEIPVIGKVAAGVPIEEQEDIIGTVVTDKNVFALRISGDSMSPRIMDGDIVLVHQQENANDGDIVIARVEGEVTCKVLKKNAYGVTLVPFNAAYAPFIYTGQQAEDLRILGKVVESRHEWR